MVNPQCICAISTPAGKGGIAVIRISGDNAISIVDSLFIGKRRLADAHGYSLLYGRFIDLDDVMVSLFRAPHSFTGEDVVEISCHGSIYIQQQILNTLINAGCRIANPGEFTQRAFINGKMDLSEAEAVADLIASENKAAHQIALNHLRGGVSNELRILREQLLHITSLIELELDFADHEDLEFADRSQLQELTQHLHAHIAQLIQSFKLGNAIKNGIIVAIIGATNAGKSTLLNALVGEERAIVSNIHGTTRDTIEDIVNINDIQFRFIDTAGLRQTDNEIENIGIERSIQAAQKADIILYIVDANENIENIKENTRNSMSENYPLLSNIDLNDKYIIKVYNKCDLLDSDLVSSDSNRLSLDRATFISAKNNDIQPLKDALLAFIPQTDTQQVLISNARHYQALLNAQSAIQRVQQGLTDQLSGEFLSLDLQDCLTALGEITGHITSQEVLNNIFANFCIGK